MKKRSLDLPSNPELAIRVALREYFQRTGKVHPSDPAWKAEKSVEKKH